MSTLNAYSSIFAHSRSFDHNDLSIMQFYSPLTVIVGHNGSGKTVSDVHSY